MAYYSGYAGAIYFSSGDPGWAGDITRWELDRSHATPKTTVMGTTYHQRINGSEDWVARLTFLPDTSLGASAFTTGGSVTVRLFLDGNDYFTLTGLVQSYAVDDPLDGPARARCTVVCNAASSYTAS